MRTDLFPLMGVSRRLSPKAKMISPDSIRTSVATSPPARPLIVRASCMATSMASRSVKGVKGSQSKVEEFAEPVDESPLDDDAALESSAPEGCPQAASPPSAMRPTANTCHWRKRIPKSPENS